MDSDSVEKMINETVDAAAAAAAAINGTGMSESFDKSSNSDSKYKRRDRGYNRNRERSRPQRSRSPRRNSSLSNTRVYVANIPFEVHWSELKDLFRDKVGNVKFCQLFENENGRPRGCGLVEFEDSASAKKACEVLHRYPFKDRELVVKEDFDAERDSCGRLILSRRDRERNKGKGLGKRERSHDRVRERSRDRDHEQIHRDHEFARNSNRGDTYGLSQDFLASIGIKGPLNNRVFIANLDFEVDEQKLEDVFKLAGEIKRIKIYCDSEGKSKGYGIVEFDHPVEAVQAISMFNNQKLYDRIITVRLDKYEDEDSFGNDNIVSNLPPGLESIGKGLGIGGQPLNITKSLINTAEVAVPPPPPPSTLASTQSSTAGVVPASVLPAVLNSIVNTPNLVQSIAQLSKSVTSSAAAIQPAASAAPAAYVQPSGDLALGNISTNHGTYSSVSTAPTPVYNTAPISNYNRSTSNIDTVFIRNLPPTFTWRQLSDCFSEVGKVCFAKLKENGTALVCFANDREAQRAVDLINGMRIENRVIEVSLYY